jgi:hypothetical protein
MCNLYRHALYLSRAELKSSELQYRDLNFKLSMAGTHVEQARLLHNSELAYSLFLRLLAQLHILGLITKSWGNQSFLFCFSLWTGLCEE